MKILIICSKAFYSEIPIIKLGLEKLGHIILLPNCYDDPDTESRLRNQGVEVHSVWKSEMINHSTDVIKDVDAVLVLNFTKNGASNYIGGATFLEMYDAFRMNKKIFLYNPIPDSILKDEIIGFHPIIINSNIAQIN